jgi:hypothetical protein
VDIKALLGHESIATTQIYTNCGGWEPNLRGRLEASGCAKLPSPLPTINSEILPLLENKIDI